MLNCAQFTRTTYVICQLIIVNRFLSSNLNRKNYHSVPFLLCSKSEDKLDEQAQAIPPYLELANNDQVEEAYLNVDISNKFANKTVTERPVSQRQQSEEPYENTEKSGSKEKKDYVNVEKFRKNKDTPDTPVAEEGLYLDMNLQPAKTKKNKDKDITKTNKDKKKRKNKTAEEVKLSHQDRFA